jgi:hypothetical protein
MMRDWRAAGPDAVWLTYAANYLLRTAGTRWMIDPARLNNLVPEAAPVPLDDLAALDFVFLTHGHSDHIDAALLRELARLGHLQWVVPRHMLTVAERQGIPVSRIIVPEPLQPLTIGNVTLTTFEGLHWEYPDRWGVGKPVAGIDAAGLLVEWPGHRVLFPGDTRTYDVAALPNLSPIDTLFAHVWLGRGAALQSNPPQLDAFCDFIEALAPTRRILLTHLWQVAREAEDYWDERHAKLVMTKLSKTMPGVAVTTPALWERVDL